MLLYLSESPLCTPCSRKLLQLCYCGWLFNPPNSEIWKWRRCITVCRIRLVTLGIPTSITRLRNWISFLIRKPLTQAFICYCQRFALYGIEYGIDILYIPLVMMADLLDSFQSSLACVNVIQVVSQNSSQNVSVRTTSRTQKDRSSVGHRQGIYLIGHRAVLHDSVIN